MPSSIRSVYLLLVLAITLPVPCLAQSCVSRLDECEKMFGGKTSPNLPVTARAEALERGLFGSARTGSMSERLQAIEQMLVGNSTVKTPPKATASVTPATARPAAPMPVVPMPAAPAVTPPVVTKAGPPRTSTPAIAKDSHAKTTIADTSDGTTDHPAESTKDLLKQAVIAHSKGDLTESIRLFTKVLSIDSKNTDANYNLGTISEDRGDLDTALYYYRNAAASSPEDPDIRNTLASVERRLSKRQASTPASASGAAPSAELQEMAKAATVALKQGDYTAAIGKLEILAQKAPSDASVQFGLSRAWYGKGNVYRSRQYLKGAIALAPDQQMYKNALQVLDREIQARQNESSGLERFNGTELATPNQGTMRGDSQPTANSAAGAIVPFTDRGAPPPIAGSVAAVGTATPVLPVGASVAPSAVYPNQGYVVNPFDQAIMDTINAMTALNNTARAYPAYATTPYVRTPRMRVGRAGSVTAGLLGLLGVGY